MEKIGSVKHDLIEKSNSRMIIMIGVAGAVLGFSIVASYTLARQLTYRERVISARNDASVQLAENVEAVSSLVAAYATFNESAESVIGTGDKNAKVVLDALPSKYDFPALVTSLEKIMTLSGFSDITIGGSDDEASAEQSSANPQPIEIPVTITGKGTYQNAQQLIVNIEKSIRPIKISDVTLNGNNTSLTIAVNGVTYYQPQKELVITKEEVK